MTAMRPMPPEDVEACIDKVATSTALARRLKGLPRSSTNDAVILAGLREIEQIWKEIVALLEGREWVN